MATKWEDAELDDHVMKVVQQTQTIVKNMQAEVNLCRTR